MVFGDDLGEERWGQKHWGEEDPENRCFFFFCFFVCLGCFEFENLGRVWWLV